MKPISFSRAAAVALSLPLAWCAASAAPPPSSAAAAWWKHVAFLASDKLEGRNAGSPGHRRAAEYVAAQFRQAGLAPCGDARGYLQRVPLLSRAIAESESSLAAVVNGQTHQLVLGEDAIVGMRHEAPPAVDAPAVFLGYALAIPAEDGRPAYNDFAAAGVDLRGKLVVAIAGSPSHLAGPLRAHFSSAAERAKALAASGAAGLLLISNPKTSDVPWARTAAARLLPSMLLDDPSAADTRSPYYSATLNPARLGWLFDGAGHRLEDLLALATAGKELPRFALPAVFRARTAVKVTRLASENVCGIWKGTRPAGSSVVLSAHVDHLGADPQATGVDKIYNGAMDNASGIATLIETARSLRAAPKPSRSIVFVAVTAEEKGLLGSRYFASHPPAAAGTIEANLNFDMFLPLHAMKKVMVFGLEESSLRAPVEAVAARLGLGVQTDLEPHRNRFIRSDQYSFIQRGIPALAFKVGFDLNSPEAALQKQWTAERYHALGDDLAQPVDLDAAVLFNRFVRELALTVAGSPDRPRWNASSFFRRFAAAPRAEAASGGQQ